MKNQFDAIQKILKDAIAAREKAKQAVAKLNASAKNYAVEYINSTITPQIAKIQADLKAENAARHVDVSTILKDLESLALAKHSELDLKSANSAAWNNAFSLIKLSGASIEADTIRAINKNFIGNISALKALRTVYKANGIQYDGGLDALIYEPETAYEKLIEFSYGALIQDGSLNDLSTAINKIATMEGIEFPQMIDDAGALNRARMAAGLEASE